MGTQFGCCQDPSHYSNCPGDMALIKQGGIKTSVARREKKQIINIELENLISEKDLETNLQRIRFAEFEYIIKKYGYRGTLKAKHLEAVDHKFIKSTVLQNKKSRLSMYFNSDLMAINLTTNYSANNNKLLETETDKKLSLTYRTQDVMILGLIFCKHDSDEAMLDATWSLVNPEHSKLVSI